ncbi:hypothetical protein EZS27_014169 [termite gut metagenome]|uniref:MobA protein n=1 Tax=termite gut metagenome TaxID=433724 RepID=A0A5J4RUR0_9ZZZZ
MNIKNVGNGTSPDNGKFKEKDKNKSKRGRKPKADKQEYRYMVRLNEAENKRFLSLYRQSGKRSMSRFMADCVLNKQPKVVFINKTLIDYTILLSCFHAQFRGIKNNYNQVFHALIRNFGEQKACSMMKILEQSTLQFGLLKREIEERITKFRELCLPR